MIYNAEGCAALEFQAALAKQVGQVMAETFADVTVIKGTTRHVLYFGGARYL